MRAGQEPNTAIAALPLFNAFLPAKVLCLCSLLWQYSPGTIRVLEPLPGCSWRCLHNSAIVPPPHRT